MRLRYEKDKMVKGKTMCVHSTSTTGMVKMFMMKPYKIHKIVKKELVEIEHGIMCPRDKTIIKGVRA